MQIVTSSLDFFLKNDTHLCLGFCGIPGKFKGIGGFGGLFFWNGSCGLS